MTITHAQGTFRMTSQRWAALAIGVPVALAMIGWLGFTAVAGFGRASFGVDYSLPVQHGQLSANVGGGNLTVHPGQAGHLTGTVHYSLIRPDITRSETAGGTNVNLGCRLTINDGCSLDGTLTVPPRTGLVLSSGGGDLSVSGLGGDVNLTSDGGNVRVSGVAGNVSVSTGGGDLNVDDLASTLSFVTYGGNIQGTALASSHVNVESYGGNVTLTFTAPPSNLEIHSYGGNVHVVVPRTTAGYDVTPTPDGGNLHDAVTVSSQSPDKITVDSGGGDITIGYPGAVS